MRRPSLPTTCRPEGFLWPRPAPEPIRWPVRSHRDLPAAFAHRRCAAGTARRGPAPAVVLMPVASPRDWPPAAGLSPAAGSPNPASVGSTECQRVPQDRDTRIASEAAAVAARTEPHLRRNGGGDPEPVCAGLCASPRRFCVRAPRRMPGRHGGPGARWRIPGRQAQPGGDPPAGSVAYVLPLHADDSQLDCRLPRRA
jgi:hypothetical protein